MYYLYDLRIELYSTYPLPNPITATQTSQLDCLGIRTFIETYQRIHEQRLIGSTKGVDRGYRIKTFRGRIEDMVDKETLLLVFVHGLGGLLFLMIDLKGAAIPLERFGDIC